MTPKLTSIFNDKVCFLVFVFEMKTFQASSGSNEVKHGTDRIDTMTEYWDNENILNVPKLAIKSAFIVVGLVDATMH